MRGSTSPGHSQYGKVRRSTISPHRLQRSFFGQYRIMLAGLMRLTAEPFIRWTCARSPSKESASPIRPFISSFINRARRTGTGAYPARASGSSSGSRGPASAGTAAASGTLARKERQVSTSFSSLNVQSRKSWSAWPCIPATSASRNSSCSMTLASRAPAASTHCRAESVTEPTSACCTAGRALRTASATRASVWRRVLASRAASRSPSASVVTQHARSDATSSRSRESTRRS
mmetsp:Transcript_88147/g.274272  ORF Transcript_88147/g.274272 Transcript_88147/m.274272 type:complete len:233 (+) Transcript_88147:108-806(+)